MLETDIHDQDIANGINACLRKDGVNRTTPLLSSDELDAVIGWFAYLDPFSRGDIDPEDISALRKLEALREEMRGERI